MSKEINNKAVELTDDEAEKAAGGVDKTETMASMQCPVCLQWFSVYYVPGKTYKHENCPGHYVPPETPSKPKNQNGNNNQGGRINPMQI